MLCRFCHHCPSVVIIIHQPCSKSTTCCCCLLLFVMPLLEQMPAAPSVWLAMSANVSVGYTLQTTDIFVCRQHVGNVAPTRRQHSLMSANFSAVSVVSVRPVADRHSYMYVGIGTNKVVTTYEDKTIWNIYRLFYIISDFSASQRTRQNLL